MIDKEMFRYKRVSFKYIYINIYKYILVFEDQENQNIFSETFRSLYTQ